MFNQSLRIIHVFRAPMGGLFRHVRDLIEGQYHQGLELGLVCDSRNQDNNAQSALEEVRPYCSLGIYQFPMSRNLSWMDRVAYKKILQLCKSIDPQIIHGHGAKGGAFARLLGGNLKIKSIYTPHGGSLHYSPNSPLGMVYLALERYLMKKSSGLIFESRYSAKVFRDKIGQTPCLHTIIHNGLHQHEFQPIDYSCNEQSFLFVGELRKLKGIETLLQATKKIVGKRPIKISIMGNGPDKEYFIKRIDQLGLQSTVTMLPASYPASAAFKRGNCLVIPSLAESFPYIVLEAVAAKMPIITTNVGGIPEIFGPYSNCLIEADSSEKLALAMERFLDEPEYNYLMTEKLYDYVKSKFGAEHMVKATTRFYHQVLELQ